MSVELVCTAQQCTAGVDGARWKTQKLPESLALQTLDRHLLGHGQQIPGGIVLRFLRIRRLFEPNRSVSERLSGHFLLIM